MSSPVTTRVTQLVGPDIYEVDNSPDQAGIIFLNDTQAQQHHFHDAGDHDYINFYGINGVTYTIEAKNLGSDCNIVVELYDADGTTLLDSVNDVGSGERE